ncbi:MAG TPA: hypothetical protein PKI19_05125 [Elusimicrobiales bacterium]|nr:hypothetical protein [Elusimicrobiales bacterium]
MYPENILKTGARLTKLLSTKNARIKLNGLKSALCPTKIFYLWEKHGVRRIEMFSME